MFRSRYFACIAASVAAFSLPVIAQIQTQPPVRGWAYVLPPPILMPPTWGYPMPGSFASALPHAYQYPPYPYYYLPYLPQAQENSRREMTQVIPAGRLFVKVEPPDALVFVNGYQLKASAERTYEIGLLIGRHRVEVKMPEYADFQSDVEIETNKGLLVTVLLKKMQ